MLALKDRQPVSLTTGRGVGALAWVPDGRSLVYVQSGSVRRTALSGSPRELLATDKAAWPTLSWSGGKDGSALFYGRGLQRVSLQKKVDLLYPARRPSDWLLKLFLGFGLGLGITSCLDFYWMLLFTPAQTVQEALAMAYKKLGPAPSITLMPMGALTVPLNATPVK